MTPNPVNELLPRFLPPDLVIVALLSVADFLLPSSNSSLPSLIRSLILIIVPSSFPAKKSLNQFRAFGLSLPLLHPREGIEEFRNSKTPLVFPQPAASLHLL